jgi:hypothetical protein
MAKIIRSLGDDADFDSRGRDFLDLIAGTTSSLAKDMDRYYSIERAVDQSRFMVSFTIFSIYILLSMMILQVTIDNGVESVAKFFNSSISNRIAVGVVLLITGVPMAFLQFRRVRQSQETLSTMQKHMFIQIDFAEDFLARVTDWESEFRSHDFYKPIIRLRINMLAQLIEEMKESMSRRRMVTFFKGKVSLS